MLFNGIHCTFSMVDVFLSTFSFSPPIKFGSVRTHTLQRRGGRAQRCTADRLRSRREIRTLGLATGSPEGLPILARLFLPDAILKSLAIEFQFFKERRRSLPRSMSPGAPPGRLDPLKTVLCMQGGFLSQASPFQQPAGTRT